MTPYICTIEFYDKGVWAPGSWVTLKRGTIFRRRDPEGALLDEGTDQEILLAVEAPEFVQATATWVVDALPFALFTPRSLNLMLYGLQVHVFRDGAKGESLYNIDLRTHRASLVVHPPHPPHPVEETPQEGAPQFRVQPAWEEATVNYVTVTPYRHPDRTRLHMQVSSQV